LNKSCNIITFDFKERKKGSMEKFEILSFICLPFCRLSIQSNARNAMTEAEKRERRALERKLSEMEEELKVSNY
jgi:hypothetical protein